MTRSLMAVLVCGALAGCVTTPYQNQSMTFSGYFPVSGYSEFAESPVVVEAFNWQTSGWEQIGATTSSATPSVQAGALGSNGPALYSYGLIVRITDPGGPAWPRWTDNGHARIRVRDIPDGYAHFAGDVNSLSCFLYSITPESDFYSVGYSCGFDSFDIDLYALF